MNKAQQLLRTLVHNPTSVMFQNKKLNRNATYAIAEVAEVAFCPSAILLCIFITLEPLFGLF